MHVSRAEVGYITGAPCRASATATARRATGTHGADPIGRHVDVVVSLRSTRASGRGWVWPPARTKATSRARAPSTEARSPKQAKGSGRSTRTGPGQVARALTAVSCSCRAAAGEAASQSAPAKPPLSESPQLSPQRTRARHFCPLVYSPFRVRECVGVSQRGAMPDCP